jgi:NAD(P)H-hydrate epimerase
MKRYDRTHRFSVFCGPGNNGGDGLALARLLALNRYQVEAYFPDTGVEPSSDWKLNHDRLISGGDVKYCKIMSKDDFPVLSAGTIVVDALLGSGLSRPLSGLFAELVDFMNSADLTVISVDMPSGLFTENNQLTIDSKIIRADYTLTFQFPKLSFLFAENEKYTGEWQVLPIGLSKAEIEKTPTPYYMIDFAMVAGILRKRRKFAHKGDFGHGLLVGGSLGKMGAVVLGARAALRSGIGLMTCHIPSGGNQILQTAIPEAMTTIDPSEKYISTAADAEIYDAVAIGPGLGTSMATNNAFDGMLRKNRNNPLVLDADGLNIIAANKDMYKSIPPGSILTPHPKEFERLAGRASNSFDRLKLQVEFSKKYKCIIVQKGAYTSISSPDGKVWFNSTGNPGMATAGSGDVLTGILLSLLAQRYEPLAACIAGVFIHGLAGDIAVGDYCQESIIASDIIDNIGEAFGRVKGCGRQQAE